MKRRSTVVFALVVAGTLVVAALQDPALPQDSPKEAPSQQSPSGQHPSVRQPTAADSEASGNKRPGPVVRIDLVVDSVTLVTWGHEDLRRIADASGVKWRPRGKGNPHPAIPVWYLLKEGGVVKDTVAEVRIVGGGKPKIFKGEALELLDHATLRTAAKAKGPSVWRLATMDSADHEDAAKRIGTVQKIRRVEVISTVVSGSASK
jgi:hypothetical protein